LNLSERLFNPAFYRVSAGIIPEEHRLQRLPERFGAQ
jgi:hypothetical protein